MNIYPSEKRVTNTFWGEGRLCETHNNAFWGDKYNHCSHQKDGRLCVPVIENIKLEVNHL